MTWNPEKLARFDMRNSASAMASIKLEPRYILIEKGPF